MNAEKCPTLPPTTMSQPFIEIPHREDASPSITTKPPCPDAPALSDACPFTRTTPDIMFSATLQPTLPCMVIDASLFMPAMK